MPLQIPAQSQKSFDFRSSKYNRRTMRVFAAHAASGKGLGRPQPNARLTDQRHNHHDSRFNGLVGEALCLAGFPVPLSHHTGGGVSPRWAVALLAAGCAFLAEVFSSLDPSFVRLSFETLALAGCGLFVGELIRNRQLTLKAEARLKALVETSPAAIVTVDEHGFIELANRAASELIAPRDGNLVGSPIAAFLPELHHALRWEEAPQFRASMQCQAHRGNGESFTADVWFSTYKAGSAPKLAAIIADVTEETADASSLFGPGSDARTALNSRELDVLRLLVQGLSNKEIAAQMEISESTVKNTLQQLFAKTDVRTRAQFVCVALERYRDNL
jgi:PAS domain S-box-containing protein